MPKRRYTPKANSAGDTRAKKGPSNCFVNIIIAMGFVNILFRLMPLPKHTSAPESQPPSVQLDHASTLLVELQKPKEPAVAAVLEQQSGVAEQQEPICRVALENKMDYHYDILEFTILRYPLPWADLDCNVPAASSGEAKPIVVFDVALAEHHKVRESTKEEWIKHYESTLKGTIKDRTDGLVRAQFGDIVHYTSYDRPYRALVGMSCSAYNFQPWMQASASNFCVLEGPCPTCPEDILQRSCWLKPTNVARCSY